jgi:hypothetical protein
MQLTIATVSALSAAGSIETRLVLVAAVVVSSSQFWVDDRRRGVDGDTVIAVRTGRTRI